MNRSTTDRFDPENECFVLDRGRRRFYDVPSAVVFLHKRERMHPTEGGIYLKQLLSPHLDVAGQA